MSPLVLRRGRVAVLRACLVPLCACLSAPQAPQTAPASPPPDTPRAGNSAPPQAGANSSAAVSGTADASANAGTTGRAGGPAAPRVETSEDAGAPIPNTDDTTYLGLAAPERGFRLVTRGREIAPGSDVEFCEVAEIPGTPGEQYHVTTVEVANARGSHHLIVDVAEPGSASERGLRMLENGAQVPCIGATQVGECIRAGCGEQCNVAPTR